MVLTNEGIRIFVTIIPLTNPIKQAVSMGIKNDIYPKWRSRIEKNTVTSEIIEPTERSMPPVNITLICPRPITKRIAIRSPMLLKLKSVRKFGFPIEKPMIKTNIMKIDI
jgi:hypothetical protein